MRYIKIALIILFAFGLGLFGIAKVMQLSSRDASVPVLTSDRDTLEIPCDYTKEQLLEGLTAHDDKDGDLTSQILVGNFSRFIEKGVCTLNYVVFDSANQAASLSRNIRFSDYYSPRFTLTQPLVFNEGEGNYDKLMECIGATDALDGSLKEWIIRTQSDILFSKAGNYHVTLEVGNSYGDTSTVELPVHVVKSEAQTLDIEVKNPIVYVERGKSISPRQWIVGVTDRQGQTLDKSLVTVSDHTDTSQPGCYEVQYEANDGNGSTGSAWVTVVVTE